MKDTVTTRLDHVQRQSIGESGFQHCFISHSEITEMQERQRMVLKEHQKMHIIKRWITMKDLYDNIWTKYRKRLHIFTFTSFDETKWFVDFVYAKSPCNIVTLGIGQDVVAESTLSQRYPQCHFLGADPDGEANKAIFLSVPNSRYVEAAVAGKSGTYSGSFLQRNITIERIYKPKSRYHMGFADFLKKYNQGQLIDLLLMDNEGGEYGIFDVMNENHEELPIICQINVEIHIVTDFNISFDKFFASFDRFILSSKYTVLRVETGGTAHAQKVFFMNVADQACIQKFLC
ncbi:methyltransferase fkbM domain-containing protein [Ditylenchus destructor]|uniref:Methyltransferase fkbM domain-containing protein n=1 Tax=Ditylenchus destructor TaxID=166010 RepID=A0AAD4QSS3_9BILA|nr:methyltransferase fkbM domain-containing protein [Ditylenchus destructor]